MELIKAMLDKVVQADTLADRQDGLKKVLAAIETKFGVNMGEAQYHLDAKVKPGPVANWTEDNLNKLRAARDAAQAELNAQPAPGTREARAKVDAANAALAQAEKEQAAKLLPSRVEVARDRVNAAQSAVNLHDTAETQGNLSAAKDELAAAEKALRESEGTVDSARVTAARAALDKAQAEFNATVPHTPEGQAKLDAARAELKAAEADRPTQRESRTNVLGTPVITPVAPAPPITPAAVKP